MLKPNDRIGPYQLIRKLGKGAFGEVWLAQNVTALAARQVALKIPLDDDIDLDVIRHEANIWISASGHVNVLPIIEANQYDGQVVIASEFAPDGSLEEWLKRHGGRAPSVEAAVEMTRGILAGLEYLHTRKQKIIHRDLKPANILLQGETPRIADFGISRVFKSTSHSAVSAGTPVYIAPEAFQRKRNEQTDAWSVGVILYQLLSGRLPFMGQDVVELLGAIRDEEPELLPAAVPEWLRQVVAKALLKDSTQRYRTAAELRDALTPPAPVVEPPPRITVPQPQPQPRPQPPPATKPQPLPPTIPVASPAEPLSVVDPYRTHLAANEAPARLRRWLPTMALAALLATIGGVGYWAMQRLPAGTGVNQSLPALGQEFSETVNGVKLEMVRVPGGSFQMGSPDGQGSADEHPQHPVTVAGFYLGKYEVTQALWQAVMGNNPSHFKGDLNRPVEQVSWDDAKAFCEKLSRLTGKTYGLPSEAEWEYACRAGTTGDYAGDLNAMAWYGSNSGSTTHPVSGKQANKFGLFDMHGNVWEWCEDVWHNDYNGAPSDGSAWLSGGDSSLRVLRGGSFSLIAYCRSAARARYGPGARDLIFGFRVAVSARTQ